MENKEFYCFEFGDYSLDAQQRSLSKNGEKVSLTARSFDLLLYMVENSGRVLEHEEILDKVWAGTFVEQATLKKGISTLRQILGENPNNEFIKTVPRRGYSFISPVRIVPETDETFFIRETEREIVIEEYEETDDRNISDAPEKTADSPAVTSTALPPAETKKTKISQRAIAGTAGVFALVLAFVGFQSFLSKKVEPQFSVENIRVDRITNIGKVAAGATISPDGKKIALVRLSDQIRIFTVNSDGEEERTITTLPHESTLLGAAWTPDGNSVLCTLRKIVDGKPIFYVSEIAAENGKETVIIAPQNKIIFGAVWMPDKSAMLLTDADT